MDKTIRTAMILAMLLGLAGTGIEAYGQVPGENPEQGVRAGQFHKNKERFMKELNLTPEQKQKLQDQRESQRQASQAVREQLRAKMQELHAEIGKPQTDPTRIKDLVADITTLKGKMFSSRVDGILATKEILTSEQFAKFQERRKEGGKKAKYGEWKQCQRAGKAGGRS